MAEGAMPGAPYISGTDEAAHFYHQPPPINGLNFDSQDHDFVEPAVLPRGRPASPVHHRSTSSNDREPRRPSSAPTGGQTTEGSRTPGPRARFPDEAHNLERKFSAKPVPSSSGGGVVGSEVEKDREPAMHRGWWEAFRAGLADCKRDFGAPTASQDYTNLIGDTGIDVRTIKQLKSRNMISNLVAPSVMLARPGLGHHKESSPNIGTGTGTGTAFSSGTPWTHSSSALTSGSGTPSTLWKHQAGVDPHEVARKLRRLKEKVAHSGDNRHAKYIQAKADLGHRRNLVLLMVYAFMAYGAPSHRIEEYTLALFKALDMEGRVNYTVGCTDISFINPVDPSDPMSRSAYTTLVKAQGLDIGACEVAFRVYKDVVHGEVTIEEATEKLLKLIESPSFYKPWFIVPFYGLASAFACVWAYGGYWTDMAISFLLGTIVGFLQIIVSTQNPLYSNVMEVTAALVTAFGARGFASIGGSDQPYFCFGAIAESSITTILPGYIVLCGALELQSKSITAGSTRLFYAVMYSLLLGYGIDVGAQLWAVIDPNAPTSADCPRSIDPRWKILLVPTYLVLQAVLLRSRPRQIPVQVLLGSAAYTVNYFVSQYATAQVADTASAFTLGVLGHLWARSRRAFAFAAVVAGIMVLVPSGLSAQGGLVSGIANPLFNNGTTSAQQVYEQNIYQSFSVGAQMIQVAVGLAVGLFLSALVIYPFGRKNNALFSF